jgi:hypothetical protein
MSVITSTPLPVNYNTSQTTTMSPSTTPVTITPSVYITNPPDISAQTTTVTPTLSTAQDPFWIEEPSILVRSDKLQVFFPTKTMSLAEKFNAIVRLSIYISIVLMLYKNQVWPMYIAIFIMVVTWHSYKNNTLESFEITPSIGLKCQRPTEGNPFMNVSIEDYYSNPDRLPACPYTSDIQDEVDHYFTKNLFADTCDIYGKYNSQRQYYTMPSSTIPNDRQTFANWLFKTGKTCKEDTQECGKSVFADIRSSRESNSLWTTPQQS